MKKTKPTAAAVGRILGRLGLELLMGPLLAQVSCYSGHRRLTSAQEKVLAGLSVKRFKNWLAEAIKDTPPSHTKSARLRLMDRAEWSVTVQKNATGAYLVFGVELR